MGSCDRSSGNEGSVSRLSREADPCFSRQSLGKHVWQDKDIEASWGLGPSPFVPEAIV